MKSDDLITQIRDYWNERIHDLEMTEYPVGTEGFFNDLKAYRFDKLCYLPKVVKFSNYKDKRILEIGCGIGIDLVQFAQGGADVTGVDLSETAVDLAKQNFKYHRLNGKLMVMNGEALEFSENVFDVVYAHGVLQYTADPNRMIQEAHRVLKKGGEFIGMVYNRKGWLNVMSKYFKVELEHEDAPVLEKYTIKEFRDMLSPFSKVSIVPERFPVKSKLHKGVKGFLFNTFFVEGFKLIPKPLIRKTGWHLMGYGRK